MRESKEKEKREKVMKAEKEKQEKGEIDRKKKMEREKEETEMQHMAELEKEKQPIEELERQQVAELERETQHRVQFQSQEDYRNEQKLIETREVETEKKNTRYNGEAVNGLTQAEKEWQEHLQMEEQLKQQWEKREKQERERQHIRLMMSDAAAGDQFDEYFDNEHAAWVSSDDDKINNIHLTTLPPVTQVAPEEAPPMSKKEKKELEKK